MEKTIYKQSFEFPLVVRRDHSPFTIVITRRDNGKVLGTFHMRGGGDVRMFREVTVPVVSNTDLLHPLGILDCHWHLEGVVMVPHEPQLVTRKMTCKEDVYYSMLNFD
jgi:hypothetical protein